MADWLSENYYPSFLDTTTGFPPPSGVPGDADTDNFDANREWLVVTFPWLLEITSIRLQGIRNIAIGGHNGGDTITDYINPGTFEPLPGLFDEELHGAIRQFEVWCSDGKNWLA